MTDLINLNDYRKPRKGDICYLDTKRTWVKVEKTFYPVPVAEIRPLFQVFPCEEENDLKIMLNPAAASAPLSEYFEKTYYVDIDRLIPTAGGSA